MTYLYIDECGNTSQSTGKPTGIDRESVQSGVLDIIRLRQDKHGNIFPEYLCHETGEWFDVPEAGIDTDDDGNKFHFCS